MALVREAVQAAHAADWLPDGIRNAKNNADLLQRPAAER
jgi:hypothetical protein